MDPLVHTIGHGVIWGGPSFFDPKGLTQIMHQISFELWSLIREQDLWGSKIWEDLFKKDTRHRGRGLITGGDGNHKPREQIYHYQHIAILPLGGGKGSAKVNRNYVKGVGCL